MNYTCSNCGEVKPQDQFYQYKAKTASGQKSVRASPYCIACNTDAGLKAKYKRQIRKVGRAAFAKQLRRKEVQLNLMIETLREVQV